MKILKIPACISKHVTDVVPVEKFITGGFSLISVFANAGRKFSLDRPTSYSHALGAVGHVWVQTIHESGRHCSMISENLLNNQMNSKFFLPLNE
jgi:hypothetical protein